MQISTKLFLLLILLIMSSASYGQKKFTSGYLITTQKDTLKGEIRLMSNQLIFQKSGSSDEQVFTADKVTSALVGDRSYVAEEVVGNKKIVQEIITGYLSLFLSEEKPGEKSFYLKRGNEVFPVTPDNLKGVLNHYLSDCNKSDFTATEANLRYTYTLKSLSKFVSFYNQCSGNKEAQVVKYVGKKGNYKPIVSIGPDFHQFRLGENNEHNAGKDFGNKVGVAAGLTFLIGKELGLAFQPCIQFTHRRVSANLAVPLNMYT
jgi:hypothetical protein